MPKIVLADGFTAVYSNVLMRDSETGFSNGRLPASF
jgi:hypothetical protein